MTSLRDWIQKARTGVDTSGALPQNPDPLPAHVGVWLDRCLVFVTNPKEGDNEHKDREFLQDGAMEALRLRKNAGPAIQTYREIFERWRSEAINPPADILRRTFELCARSRLLLHPATGSTVTEGSLLLHHTYGVPYLPASALKGICRSRAARLGARGCPWAGGEDTWANELFGWVDEGKAGGVSGLFDFWDALWVPELPAGTSDGWSPVVRDVVNPHHSNYYTQQDRRPPPSDGDDPLPTHFLTVAPGTRFLMVVEAPSLSGDRMSALMTWVIDELLLPALAEAGIGARTRAGYGRLERRLSTAPETPSSATRGTKAEPSGSSRALGEVTRNKSDGSLRAVLEGGRIADARGQEAKTLFEALPDGVRERLQRGRSVRLHVDWESVGNAKRITRLAGD